jgi:hypothetical protein
MVNEDLKRASQFDEPQDDVAVALAGLAHGVELVEPDFLQPDRALALRIRLRLVGYVATGAS